MVESTKVAIAPASRNGFSLDAQLLLEAVRRASAYSEVSLLCVAQDQTLNLVALNGANLIFSWSFCLPAPEDASCTFLIPPMIVSHLLYALPETSDAVVLALSGNEVTLTSRDGVGSYELRWCSDLRGFPAPPDMNRLLAVPSTLVQLNYLQVMDSVHRAVARLGMIETHSRIHRTKLAVSVDLPNGHLVVDGGEIGQRVTGGYYFDPRLLVRALECVDAWHVELGLTRLDSQRGYLSIVNRQPAWVMHCALLSIALDAPWLPPLPPSRNRQGRLQGLMTWNP